MSRTVRDLPTRTPGHGEAAPVGAALVARALLRVRLRRVLAEPSVAREIAAALARKAAPSGDAEQQR